MKKKNFPLGSVCKPCWELKYCPYGPLVEFFPHYDSTITHEEIKSTYEEVLKNFTSGSLKTEEEIFSEVDRLMFLNPDNWVYIQSFDPEDIGCREWGHVCPVFFTQSGATETKVSRQDGRHVARDVMFKVVRRDNHVCQVCLQYIRDDEIEFDHIIPVSKGGATSVENLRLLCRSCNRKKSNSTDELLKY